MLLMGIVPLLVEANDPTLDYISPANRTVLAGQTFTLNVSCTPGQPIKSFEFKVTFNPTLLQANLVTEGNIFNGYSTYFNDGTINNAAGKIDGMYGLIVGEGVVTNPGSLVSISFTALAASGSSTIGFSDAGITNDTTYVPITVTNGVVILWEFTLGVTVSGSGSVTKSPNQATYAYGTVVTLTAVPGGGWTFTSWSGDLTGSQNPKTITMNGNRAVTALFTDSVVPRITDIARTTSNPLDTDQLYGWVNVSCTETDNIGVSQVILRIHNPGGSWNNVSMTARTTGSYYIRLTTAFSPAGNYSYSIRATDNSGNTASSGSVAFSMPPNWDVSIDGTRTILDLVFISNHYGETGENGWIREDADNNGEIQLLDLIYVSNHFGESW
jgi:Divergent InlB B-repeat domain/Cohesin domain